MCKLGLAKTAQGRKTLAAIMYKDIRHKLRLLFIKPISIVTVTFLIMTLIYCQKKAISHVEVHGRLLNYMTHQPTTGKVELWGDHVKTIMGEYSPETILLSVVDAKEDGTFSLKSKPSKGSNYYLHVDNVKYDIRAYPDTDKSKINVLANHNNDIGDIQAGDYTFILKIKLIPVTVNNSIWLFKPEYNSRNSDSYILFGPQTSTTVILSKKISYQQYIYNPSIRITWRVDDTFPGYTIFANRDTILPIKTSDTLKLDINY